MERPNSIPLLTYLKRLVGLLLILALIWLLLEIIVRIYLEAPLSADFYSSISRSQVTTYQKAYGVQTVSGPGWVHLGWVAHPEEESYRVEQQINGAWTELGKTRFGSLLVSGQGGSFRVWAEPRSGVEPRLLGEATAQALEGEPPLYIPTIASGWQTLFKPSVSGDYINDHTIYQDANGDWRLVGITSRSQGDFNAERYFAVGASPDFPPAGGMQEGEPVADFGELAWAPHVIQAQGRYHLFWSPHALHQMESPDGVEWQNHRVTIPAPYHKFFRDPMVIQVAPGQWLLYTTARGAYFSQVDVYQSFDLQGWQYIRTALRSAWGSERNAPFASTESPFVTPYQGRYYLSLTYNNDSFFWPGILMLFKIWLNPGSYNDTLVFHSANPYDFGVYRGRSNSPTLLTELEAHAPELVYHPEQDAWYITTAGWPWVASLTSGEVAVAPLGWEPAR
jgi:hypothetical protein